MDQLNLAEHLKLYLGKSLKTSLRVQENKFSHLIHIYLTRLPSHQIPHLLQHKWNKTGPHLQLSRQKSAHTIYAAI